MRLGVPLAVLLLASGCVFDGASSMAGTSDDPGVDAPDAAVAEPEADAGTADAAPVDGEDDAAPACTAYVLEASRSHSPDARQDDDLDLGSPVRLIIPARLEVTQGNAGDHCAQLRLRRGGEYLSCAYRGGASQPTPAPGTEDWIEGQSYDFVGCIEDEENLEGCTDLDDLSDHEPGQSFEADRLRLRVEDGAYSPANAAAYDPTTVRVELLRDCSDTGGDYD